MIFSTEALNRLKKFLGEDATIRFSENYGACNPENRQLIRRDIVSEFGDHWSDQIKQNFLDLQQLPKMPNQHVSISHSQQQGVWIVAKNPVGIDIEELDRISEKIVARVCKQSEISETQKRVGSAKALWTAKESAFKALNQSSQIQVLSEIEILWQEHLILSQNETLLLSHCQTGKKISCKGITLLADFYCLSVAILNH